MITQITSPQNPRIKALVKLNKRRVRDRDQMTLVEGVRECMQALLHGKIPESAYLCPPLLDSASAAELAQRLETLAAADRTHLYHVTPEVFAKVAYRADSGGALLELPYSVMTLDGLPMTPVPFFAVIEGVEKPGNLGAILRTADAAGVDGVIVCHAQDRPATDLHNPNVIRASLGALFSVPVAEASSEAVIQWLQAREIAIIVATPDGAVRYTDIPMAGPIAVVLGSEAHGVSRAWLMAATARAAIPMVGAIDSLNLATSAALLLYEAVRQRASKAPRR